MPNENNRVALYARVSTTDQNCELQVTELREYARRRAWEIVGEFVDTGWSGTLANRPEFHRLMQDARRRAFDAVIVYKLDRWGRSLPHCIETIQELRSLGIRWIATTQNVDTDESNPMARLLLHLMAAFSEFERELIRERTQAGRLRYQRDFEAGRVGRTVHSRSGRDMPPNRPGKVFDREEVIVLRDQGLSYRAIAERMNLGVGTVVRTLQARSKMC